MQSTDLRHRKIRRRGCFAQTHGFRSRLPTGIFPMWVCVCVCGSCLRPQNREIFRRYRNPRNLYEFHLEIHGNLRVCGHCMAKNLDKNSLIRRRNCRKTWLMTEKERGRASMSATKSGRKRKKTKMSNRFEFPFNLTRRPYTYISWHSWSFPSAICFVNWTHLADLTHTHIHTFMSDSNIEK